MESKTSKEFPLISIIIINLDQLEVTCAFLESTKSLTYPNYEIILVDNNSTQNPSISINSLYPDVRQIINTENLGFTGGNNVGIRVARGEFYFIVNNDTEVTADLLERLLEPFKADPSIGVVSPKIRYYTQPDVIQYAGFEEMNFFTGRNSTIGNNEVDNGQYNNGQYTPYAHGAGMMVKKEVVDKGGPLPDIFFIYYEELDWSAHIRRAGYNIYYQPTALLFHKESMTTGKDSPFKAYYHNRNRILFMRRNTTKIQFFYFLIFLTCVVIPKKTFEYATKGQFIHLQNFYKALRWNMNNPKYTLK